MAPLRFIALCGPRGAPDRDRAVDAVILELSALSEGRIVVVDLDGESGRVSSAGSWLSGGISRRAGRRILGKVPYVPALRSESFLSSLCEPRGAADADGQTLVFLASDPPERRLDRALDALCLMVPGGPRVFPWAIPLLEGLAANRASYPVILTVLGQDRIEGAAEDYLLLKREYESTGTAGLDLRFGSCIAFDEEKVSASEVTGIPYTSLFRAQESHGMARAIAKALVAALPAEPPADASERLRILAGKA